MTVEPKLNKRKGHEMNLSEIQGLHPWALKVMTEVAKEEGVEPTLSWALSRDWRGVKGVGPKALEVMEGARTEELVSPNGNPVEYLAWSILLELVRAEKATSPQQAQKAWATARAFFKEAG